MIRAFQFAAAVLLPMAALCTDQATKKPVQPKAEPIIPRGGGNPGTVPKGSNPGRLVNPANPVVMLFKASPEERERALERATPEQQKNARELLRWFDNLSPADKAIQIRMADRFAQLSPEDRNTVKDKVAEMNRLPHEQLARVRQALNNLKRMPEEQRHRRMQNPNFSSRFTPEEWDVVKTLADVWFQ